MDNGTNELRGLSVVRVSKEFLLEKLQSNLKSHEVLYKEAMVGWHLKVKGTLEAELKKVKNNMEYQPSIYVPKPENHVWEYEKTIDLLKSSLDEEFILTSSEFSQYVRDDWSWKQSFMTTVSGCLGYGEK